MVTFAALLAGCSAEYGVRERESVFDPADPGAADLARSLAEEWLAGKDGAGPAGVDELRSRTVEIDTLGGAHVRFDQHQHGLPVFGGQAVVHLGPDGGATGLTDGTIRALTADATPDLDRDDAIAQARDELAGPVDDSAAELVFFRGPDGEDHLAYRVSLRSFRTDAPEMPVMFVDAHTGKVVWSYDNLQTARNRRTHSANNGTVLPGTLRRTETQAATGDVPVDDAHDHAGITYDFFWNEHGRDSYDGAGATITSTAHYRTNYDNAFWDGAQMVYGDGGTYFTPLSGALDVVGHELSHAVTERTAGLVYSGESGGLNEATSDIFGASIESWSNGWATNADTWMIGEDITRPALGQALRYMDNPPADGASVDNYADYTSGMDVHFSSGIANKFFYELVQDPAVTMDEAATIWYRALTLYMTPNTTFAGARTATVSAATDLFGASSAEVTAVGAAWTGVGVVSFEAFDTRAGLAASANQQLAFQFVAPTGASSVQFTISGGTGDADLYVRYGTAPTLTVFDCRPYQNGNNETCTFTPAQSGTYHVMLHAYSAFSGVTLTAKQAGGGSSPPPPPPAEVCDDGVDNDTDGDTDCDDADCAGDPTCSAPSACPGGEYVGTLSSGNTEDLYEYSASGTGLYEATLSGPAGTDFDLYLQYWTGSRWRNRATSLSPVSDELISYVEGSNVLHRWRVTRWSGDGTYTLCVQSPN